MANMEAVKVPGRKTIVTTARVFMDVESRWVAKARVFESLAISRVERVSFW